MFFVASKVLWFFAQPFTVIVLLGVVGLILLALKRRRSGGTLLFLSTLILAVCGFTTLGQVLIGPLEDRFPRPAEMPASVAGIIVLGGAVDGIVSDARGGYELSAAGDRFVEALRLAEFYPDAKLVISGGFGALNPVGETDADVAERFYPLFGVAPERVLLEGASRNTGENAAMTAALLDPQPGEVMLLVTSAFHMPRSVGLFRAQGVEVVPWPIDYRSAGNEGFGLDLSNPVENLQIVSIAVREWIGLAAYKLSGQIEDLLPSP